MVAKDYGTEATVWKNIQKHIYTISDALAGGIEPELAHDTRSKIFNNFFPYSVSQGGTFSLSFASFAGVSSVFIA